MIRDAIRGLKDRSDFRSERDRSISVHNFVRDRIAFGFTTEFEGVSPERTLEVGRGHRNAQADLFRALLCEADIPARLRFVHIDKRVLFRAVPQPIYLCLPSTLYHAVTEVHIEGAWLSTDSYIFQPSMFLQQKNRLLQSGLPVGFGLTRDASCEWNAASDSFSQASAMAFHESNPVFNSLADALASRAGNNTFLGVHFNQWLACVPPLLCKASERYLDSKLAVQL